MNAPTDPSLLERTAALQGLGEPRLRKEDARFIQGKGNYVDDLKLPGMLHMDIVRSPLAHARIKSIDKRAALAIPGVHAVLTADDLKPLKLHWMPTLAGDVAAVLADEKVHFQMQEVAIVIADDRYIAADAAEAVVVAYEELPMVMDPYAALLPDAPVLREDLAGKTSGAHGPREHHNHIFTWDAGDSAATDAAFAAAPVTVSQHMHYPRVHPCPLETCGCVASFDAIRGELTTHITSQAPHIVRTVVSLLSGIPEIHAKARKIAAHLLEVGENDLDWEIDRFNVTGDNARFKTMKDIAWASYNSPPPGLEPGLEAVHYYDPPNFTFPFGVYLCVVDIDRGTGETQIRRFYALDDCGTRINPMIIEGQIHGGLTEGFAVAMGQQMPFDAQGNLTGNTLMDYFLPTAVETPHWETDHTVTPSPHHPIGAKGVAESPHVGSIPTFTSAVVDAFAHLGVTDMTMPHSAWRVWQQLQKSGVALAP